MKVKLTSLFVVMLASCQLALAQSPQIEEPIPYEALPAGIISAETYDKVIAQSRKNPFDTFHGAYWHWVASFYTIQVQGLEILKLQEEVRKLSPVVKRFLWKPVSERNGNLAVLADLEGLTVWAENADGTIKDRLSNTGPSNGYGTTARAPRPGCAYGKNAKLYFEKDGKRVLIFSKHRIEFAPIDDGCSRIVGSDS